MWNVINALFKGRVIETDIPVYHFIKVLSGENDFVFDCDRVNIYYPLTNIQHLKLLSTVFYGKGRRVKYLKYKKEDVEVLEKFKNRVKMLFGWSEREYKTNIVTLVKYMDGEFLRSLGLDKKESDELFKVI